MKNWSAGYEILRMYVRFAFWLTHKRIVVKGLEFLPKGKPIIFAPNHQNALMDPLALACTNPLQSVWLARADIFRLKSTRPILKFLKLLPIYRIRDGKENLSNNEHIFEQVIQLLENKQSIALFPEAAHSGKRQMLPHKKAIPRIALEAEEKNHFNLDLQIVPVGIFYSHYWNFNRSVIVQYGRPICIDEYKAKYAENPQKALILLRNEIYERLAPLTLQINSKAHYQDYENIRILAGETYSRNRFFCKNHALQLFYSEKEILSKIEHLERSSPELFKKMIDQTTEYFHATENAGYSINQIKGAEAHWTKLLIQFIAGILSFPLFVFGLVFNAIPLFIPRMILRRKVKDTTFLSTFNFVSGLIVFPIFYVAATSLLFYLTDSWKIACLTFILLPFGGKYAYQLFAFYRDFIQKTFGFIGKKREQTELMRLLKQRKELIDLIINIAKMDNV